MWKNYKKEIGWKIILRGGVVGKFMVKISTINSWENFDKTQTKDLKCPKYG